MATRNARRYPIKRLLVLFIIVAWSGFTIWTELNREPIAIPRRAEKPISIVSILSQNRPRTLIGIQPWVTTVTYHSAVNFWNMLYGYLELAESHDLLSPSTIVVFPEHIGSFLFLAGEKQAVIESDTFEDAKRIMAISNPWQFLTRIPITQGSNIQLEALLRVKNQQMLNIYIDTFSNLAKRFGVTILAGSILLSDPFIDGGAVILRKGRLFNCSLLFDPTGKLVDVIAKKAYPDRAEAEIVEKGSIYLQPTIRINQQNTAILIGTDAGIREPYQLIKEAAVSKLLIPAIWFEGNRCFFSDASTVDRGVLTDDDNTLKPAERTQFWLESLARDHFNLSNIDEMMMTFLRGELWDLKLGGEAIYMTRKYTAKSPSNSQAAIICGELLPSAGMGNQP